MAASEEPRASRRRSQAERLPGDVGHLQRAMYVALEAVGDGENLSGCRKLVYRLRVVLHGGNLTSLLSVLLALQCLLDAAVHLGTNRSTVSALNAVTMLCGAWFEAFWALHRLRIRKMLEDVAALTARLERLVEGQEEHSRQTASVLSLCRRILALNFPMTLATMVVWPLVTGRLSFGCVCLPGFTFDGSMPAAGSSWQHWAMFASQYAAQSVTLSCTGTCISGMQMVYATLTLVCAALLRTVAQAVRQAESRTQLHRVLDDHRALLQVVDRYSRVFESASLCVVAGTFTYSLLATTSVIKGYRDPYVMAIGPLAILYVLFINLEGEFLERSGDRMLGAAWGNPWEEKLFLPAEAQGRAFNTDILGVMMRATKPVNIRARWTGPLCLPSMLSFVNNWYSFTQMYARLN